MPVYRELADINSKMLYENRFPRNEYKFKNNKFKIQHSVTSALIFREKTNYFNLRGEIKKYFLLFFFCFYCKLLPIKIINK